MQFRGKFRREVYLPAVPTRAADVAPHQKGMPSTDQPALYRVWSGVYRV